MKKRFLFGAIPLGILIILWFTDSCTNPFWPDKAIADKTPITLGYSGSRVLSPIDNVGIVIIGLPPGVTAELGLKTDYNGMDFDKDTNTLIYTDESGLNGTKSIEFSVNMVSKPDSKPITLTIDVDRYDGRDDKSRIPVTQKNIADFNIYANTTNGLTRHYKLTENVDLPEPPIGGSNWIAIGTNLTGDAFTGSFDGQGHKISNLVINNNDINCYYLGMFGYINSIMGSGIVKNLGLDGGSITCINSAGGIAGLNIGGTIEYCYTTINVTGFYVAGGIVGINTNGTVQNCYSTGEIRALADNSPSGGNSAAGGIAGKNQSVPAPFYPGGPAIVVNCYSTGDVHSASDTPPNNYDIAESGAGGIVGLNLNTQVQNCYATGKVTGWVSVGGIIGYYNTIDDNSNKVSNNVALNIKLSPPVENYNTLTQDTAHYFGIARVIGYNYSNLSGISNNYSIEMDVISISNKVITKRVTFNDDKNSLDGKTITPAEYRNIDWWKSTLSWDFDTVWQWNDKGGASSFTPPALQNMPAR